MRELEVEIWVRQSPDWRFAGRHSGEWRSRDRRPAVISLYKLPTDSSERVDSLTQALAGAMIVAMVGCLACVVGVSLVSNMCVFNILHAKRDIYAGRTKAATILGFYASNILRLSRGLSSR